MTMKSKALGWWLLALVYYVTVCLAHLQFSLWLVRGRDTFLGRMAFADLVPGLAIAAGLGLLGWIGMQLRQSARPWFTGALWLVWVFCAFMMDRYLTFSTNEYAHYPQYAMLAWLVARALDPDKTCWMVGRVLFWTTVMGMGDELLQYLWITTSYSDYLDFNDFLTNLVAAAAGMLLYYGAAAVPASDTPRPVPMITWLVAGVITLVVVIGLQTGRIVPTPTEKIPPGGIAQGPDGSRRLYLQRGPEFYGGYQNGPRHGPYYVLPPALASLIMMGVGLVFVSYGRIHRAPPPAQNKSGWVQGAQKLKGFTSALTKENSQRDWHQ